MNIFQRFKLLPPALKYEIIRISLISNDAWNSVIIHVVQMPNLFRQLCRFSIFHVLCLIGCKVYHQSSADSHQSSLVYHIYPISCNLIFVFVFLFVFVFVFVSIYYLSSADSHQSPLVSYIYPICMQLDIQSTTQSYKN